MTLARAQESASQVFSSENGIGNFVGVPLTDADRRKVLFNSGVPNLFLTMYPFSISTDEHVPLICLTKRMS